MNSIKKVQSKKSQFLVDLKEDFYGEIFWDKFGEGQYEPDTINFLQSRLNAQTVFLDLGTANGGMSLTAASLGSKVLAFEPNPIMFRVSERNFSLNGDIRSNIVLFNRAVSFKSGKIIFSSGKNSKILSDIVFDGTEDGLKEIDVVSLSEVITELNQTNPSKKIVIKMDIEGAEWAILNHIDTLKTLSSNKVTLLLAVHPGFYRPHVKRFRGLDKFSLWFFHLRNYRESIYTFNSLSKFASIYRTNLNRITHSRQFGALIFSGYHEFIVEF